MVENPDPAPEKAESLPEPGPFVRVPDHELLRLIGKGSYGEVWLAKNTLGAFRAIKIVYEKTFRHKRPFDREFNGVKRFEPISRLHHGLMDILQVGRDDTAGYFYCVMELADGVVSGTAIDPDRYEPRTLAHDIAKHKRLPIAECRRIGIAVASALEFLHGHKLVHRDVKPSNIVFVNGEPKLADIGLVAEADEARSYVGTEGFIAPEGPGSAQADVYSLGKVLYEISTGKDRHEYPELPTRTDDTADEDELLGLNRIIIAACRADPRHRYKTAQALVEGLRCLSLDGRAVRRGIGAWFLSNALKACAVLTIPAAIVWWAIHWNTFGSVTGLPPGLVSLWRGEGSGADAAGGNDGTAAGRGSVSYGPGVTGQAFVFDGIHRDRINVGNPGNLQLQDLTIAAWIKRSSPTNISRDDLLEDNSMAGEGGVVFGYGRTGYVLGIVNDGRLLLGAMAVSGVFSSNVVADTNWHHVAATKSGSNIIFYIDGAAASGVIGYDPTFFFDSSAAIGSAGDELGATFFGMIDELAIFNRALSAAEIRAVYSAASAGAYRARLREIVSPASVWVEAWAAEGDAKSLSGKHDGKLVNGVTFADGMAGKAFSFNGRSQYVLIPGSRALDIRDQLTIEFWMRPEPWDPLSVFEGLVVSDLYGITINSGYNSKRCGVNFFVNTDGGKSYLTAESWPSTAEVNDGGALVAPGEWHHIAGTYDGTRLQLYIDGQPWGKPMFHSGPISPLPAGKGLEIGSEDHRGPGTKGRYYKGLIDEIGIYSRALSAREIEEIHKAGAALAKN